MKNLFSMQDKVVVVTGGSGYLGNAMVSGLMAQGAKVVVADLVDRHASREDDQYGERFFVACNLAETESIRQLFQKAAERFGHIDVLVNCATFGASGSVEEMSDEAWAKGVDGAVGTTFRCTREIIPYFEAVNGGVIVNFGSMYGVVSPDPSIYGESGQNNPANYGAGKAAVIQFTRYCDGHLANKNIRVNCVQPGPIPAPKKQPPEAFLKELRNKTMLKRVGVPDEIVGAVLYLASDAASFTTGANLIVDGGWTAW